MVGDEGPDIRDDVVVRAAAYHVYLTSDRALDLLGDWFEKRRGQLCSLKKGQMGIEGRWIGCGCG